MKKHETGGERMEKITIQDIRKESYKAWEKAKEFIKQEFPESFIGSNFAEITYGKLKVSITETNGAFSLYYVINKIVIDSYKIGNVIELIRHVDALKEIKNALKQ